MLHLFQKYYLEVSSFKQGDNGIRFITDKYYLDNRGILSKEEPMKKHARQFGYFKGVLMVMKIKKLYDKSKWTVGLVPVHEQDFINYIQKGQ